jgi:BTB/POZ domain-containing protein KCTD9
MSWLRKVLWSFALIGGVAASTPSRGDETLPQRLDYTASVEKLRSLKLVGANENTTLPPSTPQYDDEELGVSFFKTGIADEDLSNLTLPRTFFGRSSIENVVFRNTDLTESNLTWNDFITVDFSQADLSRADMRASLFKKISFLGTILRNSDLRGSHFEDCKFDGAQMQGAILTREQGAALRLSAAQRAEIDWREDVGPNPTAARWHANPFRHFRPGERFFFFRGCAWRTGTDTLHTSSIGGGLRKKKGEAGLRRSSTRFANSSESVRIT